MLQHRILSGFKFKVKVSGGLLKTAPENNSTELLNAVTFQPISRFPRQITVKKVPFTPISHGLFPGPSGSPYPRLSEQTQIPSQSASVPKSKFVEVLMEAAGQTEGFIQTDPDVSRRLLKWSSESLSVYKGHLAGIHFSFLSLRPRKKNCLVLVTG